MIGIGENAHIAFNDPPADFDTKQAYIIVNLDSRCKKQQVGEGWFKDEDEVPRQAVSMTPYQIMQCAHHYFASAAQGESRRGEKGAFR